MASNFYVKTSRGVGTTLTTVGGYVVGAGVQTTCIGLTICNSLSGSLSATNIYVGATVNDGTNDTYIIRNALVPGGSSLVTVGGEQKIVLDPGYSIRVLTDTPNSADVILSVLELS